jgi:hypothetical protein
MLHECHFIFSFRYYPRFHVTAVGLGTYYPYLRVHTRNLYCNFYCNVYYAGLIETNSSEGAMYSKLQYFCGLSNAVFWQAVTTTSTENSTPCFRCRIYCENGGEIFYSGKLVTIYAYSILWPSNVITAVPPYPRAIRSNVPRPTTVIWNRG